MGLPPSRLVATAVAGLPRLRLRSCDLLADLGAPHFDRPAEQYEGEEAPREGRQAPAPADPATSIAAAVNAHDRLRAYFTGTAAYVVERHSLHAAVIEIGFNATSANGQPLVATMPLQAPVPSVEEILVDGQRTGEFRAFDVTVVAQLVRSAVNHAMVLHLRADPAIDLGAYAGEVFRLFDLGLRP